VILPVIAGLLLLSCAGQHPPFTPENIHWVEDDKRDIGDANFADPLLIWQTVDRTIFWQYYQSVDIDRNLGILFGDPQQAYNVNAFDEVPNSTWYTNRHAFEPLTPEQIKRGPLDPDGNEGPDTGRTWRVFRPKIQGATVGFWIKDARGDKYIIKFDPLDYPEMATAAAAMASRFFWACGYNVPEENIVYFRPEILEIQEGATIKDAQGVKRTFTQSDLKRILDKVHIRDDGTIRALASKLLPNVRGPFSFTGTRAGDPNDWCDHEHRRELRALYVPCSFINHYDMKDQNTMDILVTEDDRSYLEHYLIDFGSSFGSDGKDPKNRKRGHAATFDPGEVMGSLFTLGLHKWNWETDWQVKYPSIGYFVAEPFDPPNYTPIYPNPAWENMTNRDAYWGAKLVMAFREEHLRALVQAGQFSNPAAEQYLLRTLMDRREQIGRYWFSKVNPLDHFTYAYDPSRITITFDDLNVYYSLDDITLVSYQWELRYRGKRLWDPTSITETSLNLNSEHLDQMRSIWQQRHKGDGTPKDHHFRLDIRTHRGDNYTKPVRLWLWYHPDSQRFQLVGLEHID
jgi:hypothetical protein